MLQRGCVVVVPLLEWELGRADVLLAVIDTNNRLENDVAGEAIAFQRALLRFLAVASPFLVFWALFAVKLENAGVGIVVLDDTTDVWHADLDGITVEDLP